jgi:hypothetical protein
MTHQVGALALPIPVAPGSLGDPGLDILADYILAVMEKYLAAAWQSRAPGEPIVRTLSTHDPEECEFRMLELPLLSVWRHTDDAPKRLTDAYQETEDTIHIMWTTPPATQVKGTERYPFFKAFDSVISTAVIKERDPAYVHASEVADAAALAYGSDVQALAKFDWWILQRTTRVPVEVEFGGRVEAFPGYLAMLRVGETTLIDPTDNDVYTPVISATTNSGGATPLTTNTILIPQDADE